MSGPWRPFPTVSHRITALQIDAYAGLTGDHNPLHVDHEHAAAGPFGTVIAHGPIALQAVFEALLQWLGAERLLPGVMVDVAFRGPVRADDTITCTAGAPDDHAGDVVVRAVCENAGGERVLEALAIVPRHLAPRSP